MNSGYTTQNNLLLNTLNTFYQKDNNIDKMLSIINGQSSISLRLVDWFVTNYSKKHFVIYPLNNTRSVSYTHLTLPTICSV